MTEKEQFLGAVEREFPTTMKVLKAFPPAKADMKPQAKCRSAKDLAWAFVVEEKAGEQALDGAIDFGKLPAPPATKRRGGLGGGRRRKNGNRTKKKEKIGGLVRAPFLSGPGPPSFPTSPPSVAGASCWRATAATTARSCTPCARPGSTAAPRAPAGARGATKSRFSPCRDRKSTRLNSSH